MIAPWQCGVLVALMVAAGSPAVASDGGSELRLRAIGPAPAWMVTSDQGQAHLGYSVAAAGDVNGDGYDDIIVGAPRYSHRLITEGSVSVYLGSLSGLGSTPAWQAFPYQSSARMGVSVGTAGDVNGDGYDDILVGAWLYNGDTWDEGWVFVWHGGADGLGEEGNPDNADWHARSGQGHAAFGYATSAAGDVNGDGYDDIIVGSDLYDDGEFDEGIAMLWLGGPDGLGAPGVPLNADWMAQGNQDSAFFGFSVDGAGDVNGDGYHDVIVGAPGLDGDEIDEGAAFLFLGGPEGLGPAGTPANADWAMPGRQEGAQFGNDVAAAGDVNGDGFDDFLVSGSLYDRGQNDEGLVSLWLGGASGPAIVSSPESADWIAESDQPGAQLGIAASGVGDMNGDGYDDILVGAYLYDATVADEGAAFFWYGGPSGPPGAGVPSGASWRLHSGQGGACLGISVAGAGDVNRDGLHDAVIGMHLFDDPEEDEGAAMGITGCPDGDGDGLCDAIDVCPGAFDPAQDDADDDGLGDACDCAPDDGTLWSVPSGLVSLVLSHGSDTRTTTLSWSTPPEPGTSAPLAYDILRSEAAWDFDDAADCLASATTDRTAVDASLPAAGTTRLFLIRAGNACLAAPGFVGTASDGSPRTARHCP